MVPGGLFYLGQYGGADSEVVLENDIYYTPARFFSFLADDSLQQAAREVFEQVDFRTIAMPPPNHYQAIILRRAES
jgi:hypothetical protein